MNELTNENMKAFEFVCSEKAWLINLLSLT